MSSITNTKTQPKGLAASRWATPAKEETPSPHVEAPVAPASKGPDSSRRALTPKTERKTENTKKAATTSKTIKNSRRLRETSEDRRAAEEFRAMWAEVDKETEKLSFTPADYDTPRARMENPLPPGGKGLAASRWAQPAKDETPKVPADITPPPAPKGLSASRRASVPEREEKKAGNGNETNKTAATSSTKKPALKKNTTKKCRRPAETDEKRRAVAEFNALWAEANKEDEKPFFQPADRDIPRAKMVNPLPPGAKGLAACHWASDPTTE